MLDRIAWLALVVVCHAGATVAAEADAPEFDAAAVAFFEQKVRPLLAARCFECHSGEADELKGGLRLDSRAAVLKGGDSGPAVEPGLPDKSLLIEAVRYESYEMPPRSRLPDGEVALLVEWVRRGAPWPKEDTGNPVPLTDEAFPLEERRKSHWAWQPIRHPAPPSVKDAAWPQSGIDRFILAKLEASGLTPAAPADRRTLIRRISFDLIGLPPTADEVAAFVHDPSPTPAAFEKVVDRLLDSPHFGERWGRHWLDLVRYAETLGHEFDYPIPHAWRYRDYVIRALNADVPYDQFVREHIAGDLLPDPRRHPTEGFNESLIGTGFWWLGEAKHGPVDVRGEEAAATIDNQIDVFSKAFLGLTVSCARCHDHKFDAISTKDYYALAGFLQSSRRQEAWLDPHGRITAAARELQSLHDRADAEVIAAVPRSDEPFARHLLADDRPPRWRAALNDKAVKQPSHPMHVWAELAKLPCDLSPQEFMKKRQELADRLAAIAEQAEQSLAGTELFEDFDDGTFGEWFPAGWAFGEGPTRPRQWDAHGEGIGRRGERTRGREEGETRGGTFLPSPRPRVSPSPRPLHPGVAHSGRLSHRLRGVLRSKTFTITHPHILYRLAGENAKVRLVIDGYFMNEFSGLLFKDVAFDVKTGGAFQWKRQAGDLGRYIGHRAWIEIIDAGDGWIAVDEIRFAPPGSAPRPAPHPLCVALAGDESITSQETLAAKYAELWNDALRHWHDGTIDAPRQDLIAWAVEHGLFDLGDAPATLRAIADAADTVAGRIPEPMTVLAMTDGSGEDERVHIRGSHKNLGEPVPRRMLTALSGPDQAPITRGSGRLQLTERLLAPTNPLPARVMANRVWHHLFGRGIVASVDNFGVLGQEPTHPELLDHLAAQFIADGWSIKRLIRRVVLSRTYQMASTPDARDDPRDPQNLLLHRMSIRRLEGEAIRDAILRVSGRLDPTLHGPSVPVHLTPFMQGRGRPGQSGPLDGDGRRSLYVEVRRNFLSPMMLAFDMPVPFTCIGRRTVSNVPAQALILLNDPFVIEQARLWAQRVLAVPNLSTEQRIARLYAAAYSRPPTEPETAAALAFLREQATAYGLGDGQGRDDPRVWADLCHVLLNVKEFVFIR